MNILQSKGFLWCLGADVNNNGIFSESLNAIYYLYNKRYWNSVNANYGKLLNKFHQYQNRNKVKANKWRYYGRVKHFRLFCLYLIIFDYSSHIDCINNTICLRLILTENCRILICTSFFGVLFRMFDGT